MGKNILGISRSPRFSPNSEDRDAAIFSSVADRLERGGNIVYTISEDLLFSSDLNEFDLVFSMARGRDVLESLAYEEQHNGLIVVNSATKLLNASRKWIANEFVNQGIPHPPLFIASPKSTIKTDTLNFPFWIKNCDACAQTKDDVIFVENTATFDKAVQKFANSAENIIVEEHIKGDLVKFYGVVGTDFFFTSYPTDNNGFSKFGLEDINGKPNHFTFDLSSLQAACSKAAVLTGFSIYGGDAIINENGKFCIIDFNDWPSFSACRREAAKAIVNHIKNLL